MCTVYRELCIVYCVVSIVHWILCITYCVLCLAYDNVCIMHCVMCIVLLLCLIYVVRMQLACTVQIPKILGGTGGQAVYIDTEGSFMPRRAQQIAKGVKRHLDFIISQRDDKKVQQQQQ